MIMKTIMIAIALFLCSVNVFAEKFSTEIQSFFKMRKTICFIFLICFSCLSLKSQQINTTIQESELDLRIEMATNRLLYAKEPEITKDFVLACVTLNPKFNRRFTEFSGDQSGRYLSLFSKYKVIGNTIDIKLLAKEIIATQKPDGRFGSDSLVFEASKLQGNHMALLWGNGRLLTGLMDYYESYNDKDVLNSAIKLGDFLISISESCIQPDIIDIFKSKGAMGFICFTQNIEGLVKLYKATNNQKYTQLAQKIYPLIPEMGNQHTHGYLNSLRGVLMLYNVTKKQEQKEFVEFRYKELIESKDYLITGGVPEFFGVTRPSAESYRDEGCSEADWLMLSLELWQTTREMKYLNNAEYCLYNEMMFNQFESGDFGSHHIQKDLGFKLAYSEGKAWWCCDYHGLQAMLQAKGVIVTNDNAVKKINLFYNSDFKDNDISFSFKKMNQTTPTFKLKINTVDSKPVTIALRKPDWAKNMTFKLNNIVLEYAEHDGYLVVNRKWHANEVVSINMEYNLQLINKENKSINISKFKGNNNAMAMQYGPYLMSIDDGFMPLFMAEPATRNVIKIDKANIGILKPNSSDDILKRTLLSDGYLTFKYIHEGFYGENKVTMRPISEVSHQRRANVKLWSLFSVE